MAFLPRFHPNGEKTKIVFFDFEPQMCENVHNGVLFLLQEAVVCFAFETGMDNIGAGTRYAPVLFHSAMLRSSEIDRDQSCCPSYHRYDF